MKVVQESIGKELKYQKYKGFEVLPNYEIRTPIIDALIKLGGKAIEQFEQPYGVFITLSFKQSWIEKVHADNTAKRVKHKAPITLFRDSFLKWFSRAGSVTKAKDTHLPLFLWVKENKWITSKSKEWYQIGEQEKQHVLDNGYEHVHIWLFVDYAKTSIEAIERALQKEFDKGVIRYNRKYISIENGLNGVDAKRKCLVNRFDAFVKHASYAAKAVTKPEKGRNWG